MRSKGKLESKYPEGILKIWNERFQEKSKHIKETDEDEKK